MIYISLHFIDIILHAVANKIANRKAQVSLLIEMELRFHLLAHQTIVGLFSGTKLIQ